MGYDMAALVSIFGTAMSASGDLIHMSIGQPPSADAAPLNTTLTMLAKPGGLDFTHDNFESDVSPTRLDKYETAGGDASNMSFPLFMQLYNRQAGVPEEKVNYSLAILNDHRAQRVQDSIRSNAYYFVSPFGGLLVNGITHNVIFQLFANRSAEHPEGRLDRDTLTSFFGVTRSVGGSMTYVGEGYVWMFIVLEQG